MLRARPAAPHGGLRGVDPTPAARPPAGTAPPRPRPRPPADPAPLGLPAVPHRRGAARAARSAGGWRGSAPRSGPRSAPRSGPRSSAARGGGGGGRGPGALQRAPPAGRAGGRLPSPAPAAPECATGERCHPSGASYFLPCSPSAPRAVLEKRPYPGPQHALQLTVISDECSIHFREPLNERKLLIDKHRASTYSVEPFPRCYTEHHGS